MESCPSNRHEEEEARHKGVVEEEVVEVVPEECNSHVALCQDAEELVHNNNNPIISSSISKRGMLVAHLRQYHRRHYSNRLHRHNKFHHQPVKVH